MTKIFIETGKKKVFAGAIDWPGWSRSGRDEESALQVLLNYGLRYSQVLQAAGIAFNLPESVSNFHMLERHEGNATTDFGAPGIVLDIDREPLDMAEFERMQSVLMACWQAFDSAIESAKGKELQKGPRGGGRELEMILDHVVEADQAYLPRLAWKHKKVASGGAEEMHYVRESIQKALNAAMNDGLPEQGPRGGVIWPVRYFIRRVSWHVLDHAWEIEDRIQ